MSYLDVFKKSEKLLNNKLLESIFNIHTNDKFLLYDKFFPVVSSIKIFVISVVLTDRHSLKRSAVAYTIQHYFHNSGLRMNNIRRGGNKKIVFTILSKVLCVFTNISTVFISVL